MKLSLLIACGLLLVPQTPHAFGQSWQEGLQGVAGDDEKPALIDWQRSLADAEALAERTGRPLLVCVNFDGEPASEVFARSKYKNPEFARLVATFVPILVSTSRHNERDHDENGRRILCPRFGAITCAEHIRSEPGAYRGYFDGRRLAPRHIGAKPDGTILFDRYLDQDLGKVDAALEMHGAAHRDAPPIEAAAGQPGLVQRIASRAARDRTALEVAYVEGDAAERATLLTLASGSGFAHDDLIRLGLHETDPQLHQLAVAALEATAGPTSVELVLSRLDSEAEQATRLRLLGALRRVADFDPGAQQALAVRSAIATASATVDASAWRAQLIGAEGVEEEPLGSLEQLAERIDLLGQATDEHPDDPAPLLGLAQGYLDFARQQIATDASPLFSLMDADQAAEQALERGADPVAVAITRAPVAYLRGEVDQAGDEAALAVPGVLDEAPSARAAELLDVLARSRTRSIYAADEAGNAWEPAWLTDANAAYAILALHPLGSADQSCAHVDLLRYFNLRREADAVIGEALARHPLSSDVHTRFRGLVVDERGIEALVDAYEGLRKEAPDIAGHEWFTGYAAMIVAEDREKTSGGRSGRDSYARARDYFQRSLAARPDYRDSSEHYIAMALAAEARIALAWQDLDEAVALIAEGIGLRVESAETPDGVGGSPLGTLRSVRRAIEDARRDDLAERLAAALEWSAPEVWGRSE